ncbi:MAG TPA: polysaccharide deacetylase family protein [Lacipirellulaceae bacterium]|nr:polysaccharide deacetylase family protein [Lacipirellulaceae bacterium]
MWKEAVLQSYYWSTLPSRRGAAARRAARCCEPVQILFYHRVADDRPNGWTISTAAFAKQIGWLRKKFEIASLADAQARITSGRNDRPTACITFDDGYADNQRFAIPLLLQCQIPFTYFVSTNHVLGGEPFPHDLRVGQPLAVNTLADLRHMAAAGVEIGAHTRSHADLARCSSHEALVDEIDGSKRDLESALNCEVRYFAFPYGLRENMSAAAFQVAYEAGFAGVCSAYGGYNFPGDDAFHLRRFHADPEIIRFKNWLTMDERKVRGQRDFDPGKYQIGTPEGSRNDAKVQSDLVRASSHTK